MRDDAALLQVGERVGGGHAGAIGTSAPVARDGIGPCHGSQPANRWFMMPVPLVSVRNCDRKPIRPRAGMRNSMRTRPLPWLTILVMVPRRVPQPEITTPW